jgi:hypothetical protein
MHGSLWNSFRLHDFHLWVSRNQWEDWIIEKLTSPKIRISKEISILLIFASSRILSDWFSGCLPQESTHSNEHCKLDFWTLPTEPMAITFCWFFFLIFWGYDLSRNRRHWFRSFEKNITFSFFSKYANPFIFQWSKTWSEANYILINTLFFYSLLDCYLKIHEIYLWLWWKQEKHKLCKYIIEYKMNKKRLFDNWKSLGEMHTLMIRNLESHYFEEKLDRND